MADDTIFALSTGFGRAAIAVVRVSGPAVRFALETLAGGVTVPRMAVLRRLRRPGSDVVLDQALVLFFPAPRSETGEDLCEFQLHGGRAVVAAVLDALGNLPGLRPAEPGEFARRALLNGKMDLLDLEGLADLIDADTEAQRRQAVEGAGSLLRGKAESWRLQLLAIRADLEAGIDFSDEGDIQERFDSQSERLIKGLIAELEAALHSAERGERIREGFRVALLGPPNAGKSSLLNALAGRNVAIVSQMAGTTRDRLEVALDLGGVPVLVSDTAGLQASFDEVELEGIRRSRAAAAEADLILWLSPFDGVALPPDDFVQDSRLRVVLSKCDLAAVADWGAAWLALSTVTGEGVAVLLDAIAVEARSGMRTEEPALIARARQRKAVAECRDCLVRALAMARVSPELCSEDIRLAGRSLERLIGRVDVEDVLGAIFSRFCIGK